MVPSLGRSPRRFAYPVGMIDSAQRLVDAVAASLPAHLSARLEALGVPAEHLDATLSQVTGRAVEALTVLLALPFDRQPEAPLEVVRHAIAELTDELDGRGIEPPVRDAEQERIAPDDVYGLAPASAAELGDDALHASLAWGVEKAQHVKRPLALVVTSNLLDGSRFEQGVAGSGYRIEVRRDTTASARPLVAFVDLEYGAADEAIRSLAEAGVRVIAYGPHVDDHAMVRARSLGAAEAEPRSRVLKTPASYLPTLV